MWIRQKISRGYNNCQALLEEYIKEDQEWILQFDGSEQATLQVQLQTASSESSC